jgi:hypothetical protein
VLFIAPLLVACSNTSGDDAGADGADCAWNALIPHATEYACDAEAVDAYGCVGDPKDYLNPSASDGGAVHPLGCQATTPLVSGSDIRCQQMKCGCLPLACFCQTSVGDAAQWVCPN